MAMTRRSFILYTAALAALGRLELSSEDAAWGAAPATAGKGGLTKLAPTTLHGYGTISAISRALDGGASLTHITCESAPKAWLTQAKYLSDLERLPGLVKADFAHGGQSIPYHRTPTGGAIVCYARGRDVMLVAAVDEQTLARNWAALPTGAVAADFVPRVAVPMWLDRWDRYGLLCYIAPDAKPPNSDYLDQTYDYADALTFVRDNGPLGLVIWTNPLTDDIAEGITNEQSWDWLQTSARKMGVPVHINTQISPPQLWLANRFREQTMLRSPQFLGGYYGVGHDSSSTQAISWLSQEAEDALLGVFQHTVRRFAPDPNIVGWLEPHGETAETPQKFFLDSGAYADAQWRAFLKPRYPTLRALSTHWYGDAAHLKSWDDVHVPEVAEFAGFGPDAIDLRGTWRVKYVPAPDGHTYTRDEARGLPSPPPTAPVPPEWYQPSFDDKGWDEFVAPGNDRMLNIARSPLVYRRTLDIPAGWLEANEHATLTIWDMVNREADVTTVYINGKPVTEQRHNANDQHWSQFDVTGALQPGSNLLVLQMPRAIICYRAYLTKAPPLQYPRLGTHLNARWVDFVEWQIESRGAQIRRGAEMIRQVDADSSINFMAAGDYADPVKRACQDYGGRFHDTGAMAGFWTEENTLLMNGVGLPVTAEPGNGAPNPREFQMFWGRWITEGVTGVHYFQNWGEIAWNPEVLKVFEANRPLYNAVGKYHSPFAQVAVLYNLRSQWLTGFPWVPEPETQGGYYSTYNTAGDLIGYCPRDAIGAADFGTPTVDRYRVILDGNSSFMNAELLAGIEKWVRNGGVFITHGQTGRHTPVQPDTWPISRLTGYEVPRVFGWGDNKSVSPAPGQTVFNPTDAPPQMRSVGLSLKKTAGDAHDLLVWDDGSVAVGMRPLGKGWIVHFGPLIRGEDYLKMTVPLLRHFGVIDRVPATVKGAPGLHFRHFIGNAGLHDVWVLFNESDSPVTTDLTFLLGVHPTTLTDIVTGQPVKLTRDATGDAVRGIVLEKWQSKMYLSPRADVTASPLEWLNLQRGWWQGTTKPPAKHLPTAAEQQRFSLDLTEGWAYKRDDTLTDDGAAALAQPSFDDSKWERRTIDMWLNPGAKNAKRIILRRKFTVPAHWTSGPITLNADVPYAQFFHETRIFLDGKPWLDGRKMIDGPYFDTMGDVLKPGTTHVLTLDIQSKSTLMGSRGPIWLYYLPEPRSREDLSGTWTAYSDPMHKTGDVKLPGTVPGMYLQRTVVMDPAHEGRNVVIYYESPGHPFALMFNGQLLGHDGVVRARQVSYNVTPLVKFGAENVVELVSNNADAKTVQRVEIRYYDKGVYP